MHSLKTGRPHRVLFVSLVAVALISLTGVPAAIAASQPLEQILHVTQAGRPQSGLSLVESRLTFSPGDRWETDPEAGPLTITVESGKVGVVLGGGLARIERHVSPLQDARFHRLEPGRMAILWPGDTLVVIRGYHLRVDNDEDVVAAAMVSRVLRAPLPAVTASELPGQPR